MEEAAGAADEEASARKCWCVFAEATRRGCGTGLLSLVISVMRISLPKPVMTSVGGADDAPTCQDIASALPRPGCRGLTAQSKSWRSFITPARWSPWGRGNNWKTLWTWAFTQVASGLICRNICSSCSARTRMPYFFFMRTSPSAWTLVRQVCMASSSVRAGNQMTRYLSSCPLFCVDLGSK